MPLFYLGINLGAFIEPLITGLLPTRIGLHWGFGAVAVADRVVVTTKLAPEASRAQMMALYFFSVGLGTSMSGVLAKYYDSAWEFALFGIIGALAIVAGVVVFALVPGSGREMEGVRRAS